jgi:hypothetical protein
MAVVLTDFQARGFPGLWDQHLATTPVAGIDRVQCHAQILVTPETSPLLYDDPGFSPRRIRYRQGSRPELERLAAGITGHTPTQRVINLMNYAAKTVDHPHYHGPLVPDRGMSEEALLASGVGYCNEQSRVFLALCQVLEIPSRLCFLYHANTICGHVATEVWLEGRWAFFDVSFMVHARLPDGRLAEGRELSGPYRALAHAAYRPALQEYERRLQPFVENCQGWRKADRPTVAAGGDLLATIAIGNYLTTGVMAR